MGGLDIREIKKTHLRAASASCCRSRTCTQERAQKHRHQVPGAGFRAVREAAVSASVHEDIMGFEDGYETLVASAASRSRATEAARGHRQGADGQSDV